MQSRLTNLAVDPNPTSLHATRLDRDPRSAYGLTSAEAVVAQLLVQHAGSVRDIADRLGVSVNTAKTHLKRIFDKTGVRRQSALIKLLLESDRSEH